MNYYPLLVCEVFSIEAYRWLGESRKKHSPSADICDFRCSWGAQAEEIMDHARLEPALHRACYHLKGHGGLKGAVREVIKVLPRYRFFCKTDVRSIMTPSTITPY